MYRACLFCSHALGRNEVVETLPVGRRLAYDEAKGRLWVVCQSCGRWCLTPIEERWETIESCERLFRGARVRASTPEISLVKLGEGLELVRVGAPLRPEMAAWRYGREFSARRRRTIAVTAGVATVAVGGAAGAAMSGAGSAIVNLFAFGAPMIHMVGLAGFTAYAAMDSLRATRLVQDGHKLIVYREDLQQTHLVPAGDPQGWGLMLKHSFGRQTLRGDDAVRVTSRLLARVNGAGASRFALDGATARLADLTDPVELVRINARYSARLADEYAEQIRMNTRAMDHGMTSSQQFSTRNPGSLKGLAPDTTLALEMALHEEAERVALEGELAPLVRAWREAEEIAGIADALAVPAAVEQKLRAMRSADDQRR
jgi:hypothetical protein